MDKTTANIGIIKNFLRDVLALDCSYVQEWEAFYVKNNIDDDGFVRYIYITWDKAVEAYNIYVNNLLNINQ